ncbi:Pyridoxal phosphate-dependent transferase [Amanita muscaria]
MDVEQFRKAGYQAIDRICDYYYSLQEQPVVPRVEPGYLRLLVPPGPPEKGEDFQIVADDYQKFILPGLTHWQHPSFFAFFPAGCTFEGMLADLYSTSVCNPGFNWSASPACTELEAIVMDWAAQLLSLSPAFFNSSGIGGGVIQSTASDSALAAIVAARFRYQRMHPGVKMEDLVIYTTTQTHSLGTKAGIVLGLRVRHLQVWPEDRYALRGATLRTALEEDVNLGRKPFFLIATVGTTSSGAIDNLQEIGEILKDHPLLWLHVDAAWAGVALSCPEYRDRCYLNEINAIVTSFGTSFHKWGLTNLDTCTLWVRDRKLLTDALDVTPPFLRSKHSDLGSVIDYRNWHLALGRRFRAVKLWFVLRSFGVEGFQNYIRRSVQLNEYFADLVRGSDLLELVTETSLALSVFRLNPSRSKSMKELNELNRLFYDRISSRDDILLTQTVLNGVACIRFAVGAYRTEKKHIDQAFQLLLKEGRLAIKEWKGTEEDHMAYIPWNVWVLPYRG